MRIPTLTSYIFALALAGQVPDLPPPPPPSLPTASAEDAKAAGMRSPEEIQYWRALSNHSTATSYVVITLVGPSGRRAYCTEAPFLLGAIHKEYHLPYSRQGEAKAFELALKGRTTGFEFKTRAARKNIPILYNDLEAKLVQEALSNFSNQQILERFKDRTQERIESFVASRGRKIKHPAAIAHVLYLKGLSVGRGCINSSLWISE